MSINGTEKEFSVQAPWGTIKGVTWGDPSHPPILLVHGKLDVCTGFRPLVCLLPQQFYFVAFDVPGNGRSDPLPRGVRYTVLDLVPSVVVVTKHFGWDKFIYIGHSLGALIGKYFNIVYPNRISRVVELDPVPAHHNWETSREALRSWYLQYYSSYDEGSYQKHHGRRETAPTYTYEKAQELVMKSRKLTVESSKHVLERCLEPAENGLYRFTYDQRMKEVTVLPFSPEILQKIYTTTTTPTFATITQDQLNVGRFSNCGFVKQEDNWPNKNYKVKVVEGDHDVHIYNPECLAKDVANFIMEEIKSKL